MPSDPPLQVPVPALVLTGGGARSAYQAGVLKAVAAMLPGQANPFRVIVGTSGGAVAASVLAGRADQWHKAVRDIEHVWANFRVGQVYRADTATLLATLGACAVQPVRGGGTQTVPLRVEPRGIIEPFEWLVDSLKG